MCAICCTDLCNAILLDAFFGKGGQTMRMIPDEEIERIKREADLAAVVRSRGVDLKAQGHDLVGLCPFHDDQNPSLRVTPGKGLWRCMSCNATGNVIQFVQRFDGVSFRHAFELLKSNKLSALSGPVAPMRKSTVPRLESPLVPNAEDQELLRQVLEYYQARLRESPAALGYLQKRGITEEAIATFRIGYADRTLGLRLPNKQRVGGAALRSRLETLGLYRKSGHEHLSGRVVFPVIAETGAIGTLYGRAIQRVVKEERHLFLPGPMRGIWNPVALRSPEVIVTEGIIDALTWWCAGFRNVTTAYSAKGLPEELLDALVKAKVQRVLVSFDRDKAGDDGAALVAAQLRPFGIEVCRILFPPEYDANRYALEVRPAAQSLGVLLRAALGRSDGRGLTPAPSDANASGLRGVVAATSLSRVPASLSSSLVAAAPEAAASMSASMPTPVTASAALEAAKEKISDALTPASLPVLEQRGEHWFLELEAREYRVGGLEKTVGTGSLKVVLRLKVGQEGPGGTPRFHLDALDLSRDGERKRFVERAAEETGLLPELLKRDVAKLLLAAEQAQGELMRPAKEASPIVTLTPEERAEALQWLTEPDLVGRLRAAFHRAGLVGEENNLLLGYLAGVSRKLERPLAIIVQSASAAGKTTLMDAVLAFFPEEERIKYSAMTGQSLYYLGETNLKHKILAIVEETGAEKASYALKLLQSEGELSIASTGKDPATGRMVTQEYRVEGPVMIFLTTTAIDLDEELQNRCLTLAVDDSAAQTVRIHELQRERRTFAGLVMREERKALLKTLRNAQRLLRPLPIGNDHAPSLTFPAERTRTRRDNEKYLTLIDAIALLHQYQRPLRQVTVGGRAVDCIEVLPEDIALANELMGSVLARSLDELPPQTRTLLGHIRALACAKKSEAFTRRELREASGWSLTQTNVHLERLVALEYLAVRCGRMGSQFVYELLVAEDRTIAAALKGPESLQVQQNLSEPEGNLSGGDQTGPIGAKPLNGAHLALHLSASRDRTSGGAPRTAA